MIITSSDIARAIVEATGAVEAAIVGSHTAFLSSHVIDGSDNICGFDVIVFAVRLVDDDSARPDFYVDLAFETSVAGFYITLDNVLVTSVSTVSLEGQVGHALCKYEDVDRITKVYSEHLPAPKLYLVKPTENKE